MSLSKKNRLLKFIGFLTRFAFKMPYFFSNIYLYLLLMKEKKIRYIIIAVIISFVGFGIRQYLSVPNDDLNNGYVKEDNDGLKHYVISGNDADPDVSSKSQPNYVYLKTQGVTLQNRLLVYLPGSGGTPSSVKQFLKVAAGTGVHVIGLQYNNNMTLNMICKGKSVDCYETARLDIIHGNGYRIKKPNSILNRLCTLLTFLHKLASDEGWGQFLTGDTPVWSSIILSGHSQGGGHAALIARDNLVHRVIMFNSPTDKVGDSAAPWLLQDSQTPKNSYYAFGHIKDKFKYRNELYKEMGIDTDSDPVNVDETDPPYSNAHKLYTTTHTSRDHAATIRDDLQGIDETGESLFAPAWRYLIGKTN